MQGCRKLVEVGRRQFLKGGGAAAAGAIAGTVARTAPTQAAPALARVSYPSNRLANLTDLKLNEPLEITYPDPRFAGRAAQARPRGRRRRRA